MKIYKYLLAALLAATCMMPAEALVLEGVAGGRNVSATMLSGNIVKVTNTPAGVPEPPEQTVLVRQWPDSSAVPRVGVSIDSAGVLTITDRLNGTWLRDSGLRSRSEGKSTLVLSTNSGGSFYGAGERDHKLNLRGDTLVNYNRQNYGYTGDDQRISQMNITMPVLLSSDGFALLFDDFAASTMVASDSIVYTTESDLPVTYYYIGGVHSLAELTTALTSLTGRQPLPPFWAMGYITSKYGYKSPEETVAAVDSLRGQGYPLDGIVLDLYWFGREQDMGFLDWDRSVWPDPEGMMRRLADRGVKLITVSEPYILRNGTGIDNYNTLDADSMMVRDSIGATHPVTIWVGEGGMFDVSNPKTRRWLGDRYRMLTDLGVGGWWGDLGEPEVHPETGFHANGLGARKYHNHYGNDWSSIISELYAEHYPDRRLITLMRGGTTGLQRHSVFPWSTDVSRSWGGLEPQIRIMLNSGLSGLGYMSSDLGGFAVDEANPYMPELYVRWLEAGLFTPVFRTHAQQFAEPFNYPQYHSLLVQIVRERYRWLPYNYSLAWENATKGWPLARPLDFGIDGDGRYDNVPYEYLWGNDLLIAPVVEEGAVQRRVVFPAGSEWIDFNDPELRYAGGSEAIVKAPLEVLPVFVRAGSIFPTADYNMNSTADYRADAFTVNYFPGEHGQFTLYDDNRESAQSLAKGEFRLIDMVATADTTGADIRLSSRGTYPGAPASVELEFVVYCMEGPATVSVDGVPVDAVYDPLARTVNFKTTFIPSNTMRVRVGYHL